MVVTQRDGTREPRAGRVFRSNEEVALVAAIVTVSAVAGGLAGCRPAGVDWANPLITGAMAGGVVLLGAFAGWRWLLAAAAVALVASRSWWGLGASMVAFGLAGYAATRRRPPRAVRAAAAAIVVQVLLRLPSSGPFGLSAAVAAVGLGLIAVPALVRCPSRVRRAVIGVVGGAVILSVIATAVFAVGVLLGRNNLEDAVSISSLAIESASAGNTDQAASQFEQARTDFRRGNDLVDAWWARPARLVPYVGLQARAVQEAAHQGQALASTGTESVNAVERNRATAKGGQFDLGAIAAAVPDLDRTTQELGATRAMVDQVDSRWLISPLARRLHRVAAQVDRAEPVTRNAALAAHLAPSLLGGDKPAIYFVAFVTPAEERGSGGFMGSFAELTVTNGRLEMTRYGRTDELNRAHDPTQPIAAPVDWTNHYGAIDPTQVWSNITLSPDLPTVAQVIGQLYPASGGRPIDGVITVDPAGLAALLAITGPIKVPGLAQSLTTKNAESFLVHDQYTTLGADSTRTDVLADAAEATFRKLVRSDIPRPDKLAAILGPAIAQEHLRWAQLDAETNALPQALGTTGSLAAAPGDFVQLVTQNYANNKLDAFLHRTVSYDITVDPATGAATGTAHVELQNQSPASGLPKGVIGNERGAPPGTNICQVTLYSTLTATTALLNGGTVDVQSFGEAGRHAVSLLVSIPPGGTASIDFDVSGFVDLPGGAYHLTVGHQVMVNPDSFTAMVRSTDQRRPATPDGAPFVNGPGGMSFATSLTQRDTAQGRFG